VIEKDLEKFTNLHTLNASENLLPFARLGSLLSLKNLNFSCNALKSLDLDVEGKFQNLEHLELQSNTIDRSALIVLATLPNLKHLDLTRNGIKVLHNDFCNMKNWQEKVIELILPFHVSGLKEDQIEIGVPVQMDTVESNRRAFSQSSDSLASLPKAIELNLGFKALETLILNDNPLGMAFPSTFWGILSPLPQYCLLISLKRLYLNHVSLKSFKPLVSRITMDLNLESLHLDQNDIPKLDGFHKLQVLHVTNNLIAEVEDLLGFIHLPALSKIYLEANPVMTKILPRHLQPKRKKSTSS
jgi:Leucine-rich repeat (LRR) protein